MRGGANGSRIRLAPQKDWEVNNPNQLQKVLSIYESISADTGVSIADVIILAGNVGVEMATGISVPFTPGRGDASQEQTDADSFAALEPVSDAFRNFHKAGLNISAEEIMLDKAQLLGLTAPEMTVILGGMRSMGISSSGHGVFTDNQDKISNDYFSTLLDMSVEWKPNASEDSYEAFDRSSGEKIRTASRADLVFGSNSQLRALAEVYASNDGQDKLVNDFISAWNKVMNNDRFDVS
jgi:catalase-peroxidase